MPALNPDKKLLPIASPIKGVNRFASRENQAEGTCWDALNVLPFDRYQRLRIGQRNGTAKQFSTQLTSGNIQAMTQAISPGAGTALLTETWPYTAGSLETTGAANWTLVSSSVCDFHANGDNTVSVTPLTGNGQVTASHNANFADTTSLTCTFTLTMQAGTGAGDNNTFVVQFYDAFTDFLFEVDILHEHNAGTPRTKATIVDAFSPTSNVPVNGPNANGTWAIIVTGLSASSVCTPTFTVTLNGTTVLTHTSASTFYGAVANIYIKAITSQTAGVPTFTLGNPLTVNGVGGGRLSRLIAVAGGNVWQGTITGGTAGIAEASNQSSPPLDTSSMAIAIAAIFQKAYLVDGTSIVQYDIPTNAVETYTVTAGTAPLNCTLACNWRSRLVLSGDVADPQNFFMSRCGTPTDWDYGQTDPAAAVAGNLSKAGQIGEPIVALIPFTDDILLIGCTHSLWMVEGDPADGGAIVSLSDNMGLLGPNAWCKAPDGTLYFLGTGGLFAVRPPAANWEPPKLLTGDNYNQFFQTLDQGNPLLSLIWDVDLHYLYIFTTPSTGGGAGSHLVYDGRAGGFWPIAYPSVQGPTCATQYFGDGSANARTILMGGTDGYIRRVSDTAYDDDGTAISASITFGPFKPFPEAGLLSGLTLDYGEVAPVDQGASPTKWNALATVNAGPDAYSVTQGTPHSKAAIAATLERRQKTIRQRLRGGWFSLTVSNSTLDTYFAFETGILEFSDAGRNRERR